MEGIAVLAGAAAFIGAVYGLGVWVLRPVDRAAQAQQAPVRYSIADFLCMFVIFQIPLAFAYRIPKDEQTRTGYWFFVAVTWIMATVIWFTATRALSKAGVATGWHRMAFVGLVVPLAYYGGLPFIMLTYIVVASLFVTDPDTFGRRWIPAAWLALGVLLFLGGLYTRWMLKRSQAVCHHGDTEDTEKTDTIVLRQNDLTTE